MSKHHFDLSPAHRMPVMCDWCWEPMSIEHALDCKRGGLVIQRHNEVRMLLGTLQQWLTKVLWGSPLWGKLTWKARSLCWLQTWRFVGMAATDLGIVWCSCHWHWCPVLSPSNHTSSIGITWRRREEEEEVFRCCRSMTSFLYVTCGVSWWGYGQGG